MIPLDSLIYGTLASITGAFGAFFLKKGARSFSLKTLVNSNLVLGFVLYVLTTIFFVLGLRNSPLSFLFPFTALMYLFAALLGFFVLKESVNRYKLLGIGFIILGIILNSIGR